MVEVLKKPIMPIVEKKGRAKTQKVNKTEIQKCDCKSEFQDAKYGKGMRIKNSTGTGNFRCTVCSK